MRFGAAAAVIVAASLSASPATAQDEIVLHEFAYTQDDMARVLADRPTKTPAEGLTVEFEPTLKIRTVGSTVTAIFTDLAFGGTMADGCSSRLAYSTSSAEIAAVGDGVFDVLMEGYWDWQYTFHEAAGDTGDVCQSKEQELTQISGTITVRMIDRKPFVEEALSIVVPLESFAPQPTPMTTDPGDPEDAHDQLLDESTPAATITDPDVDTDQPAGAQATDDGGDSDSASAAANDDEIDTSSLSQTQLFGLVVLALVAVGVGGWFAKVIFERFLKLPKGIEKYDPWSDSPLPSGFGAGGPGGPETDPPESVAAKSVELAPDPGALGADQAASIVLDLPNTFMPPIAAGVQIVQPPGPAEPGWEWHQADADDSIGITNPDRTEVLAVIEPGQWYQTRPGPDGRRDITLYDSNGKPLTAGVMVRGQAP